MFYTYILQSLVSNKHYYGQTENLLKRVEDHNTGFSKYTKRFAPWKLIYFEEFNSRSEAMIEKNSLNLIKVTNG